MPTRLLLAILVAGVLAPASYAQAVRAQPYNAQLRTDPAVGNVQGIQRYGRPLKTDPDEGEGYSYHVYPVAENPSTVVLAAGQQQGGRSFQASVEANAELVAAKKKLETALEALFNRLTPAQKKDLEAKLNAIQGFTQELTLFGLQLAVEKFPAFAQEVAKLDKGVEQLINDYRQALLRLGPQTSMLQSSMEGVGSTGIPYYSAPVSPYPPPFNATAGLRLPPPLPPGIPPAPYRPVPLAGAIVAPGLTGAVVFTPPGAPPGGPTEIYHQPLIQVKVRVVEVARTNQLQVSSVLDIIGRPFDKPTLISGNNVNRNQRDVYSGSRFGLPQNLINFMGNGSDLGMLTGSGALVNLTTGNLNYIARLLATEFHSDVVTAPEVVTLNGQNVEFVAGEKLPFALGQDVIQGNAANIQQFFYKHVGTYVSITPRIVNWGKLAEGSGKAPVVDSEIANWHAFLVQLDELSNKRLIKVDYGEFGPVIKDFLSVGGALPVEAKARVLDQIKGYSKSDLLSLGVTIVDRCGCGPGCDWHAQDCTIDLETVVRLSEGGTLTLPAQVGGAATSSSTTTEANVRGIANIVHVKSGHGVVMGGLIGERDIKQLDKVPVLGDIPLVGFFFRSQSTQRQKTEVLIFIEARVLDPEPETSRAQSYENFTFGAPFVAGGFLDNPLDYGMYRAGFGSYLPPHSPSEKVFWERLGRKVRRVATTLDDMFE